MSSPSSQDMYWRWKKSCISWGWWFIPLFTVFYCFIHPNGGWLLGISEPWTGCLHVSPIAPIARAMFCPQKPSCRPLLLMSRWRMKHTHREIVSLSYLFNGNILGIYGSVHRPLVKRCKNIENDSSRGTVPYEIEGKVTLQTYLWWVWCSTMRFTNAGPSTNPRCSMYINVWYAYLHLP